jgi:integral membrane sensor domain MASE1
MHTSKALAAKLLPGAGMSPKHDQRQRAQIALLVFAGYYIGAKIGLAFTFEPNPISVLWPPNSILFAALLLTPPRNWWIVLVAAFPAHLLAELQGGVPPVMVMCWYVSNVAEALIGATAAWVSGCRSRAHW